MNPLLKTLFYLVLALPLISAAAQKSEIPVYNEQKTSILVSFNKPEFIIKLKSNPSTGYSWFLDGYDSRYLEPVKHRFQAAENQKLIGAPGYELWTFKVKPAAFPPPRKTKLQFIYARPWEKNKNSRALIFWVSSSTKN